MIGAADRLAALIKLKNPLIGAADHLAALMKEKNPLIGAADHLAALIKLKNPVIGVAAGLAGLCPELCVKYIQSLHNHLNLYSAFTTSIKIKISLSLPYGRLFCDALYRGNGFSRRGIGRASAGGVTNVFGGTSI